MLIDIIISKNEFHDLIYSRTYLSLLPALGRSAELLGLDSTQLTEALTQRSMILRGEEILTPISIQQVKPSMF